MLKETIRFVVVRKMNRNDIEIYLSKLSKYESFIQRIKNTVLSRDYNVCMVHS